ncbi:MAG TPA: hypothetical protein VII12_10910 [Thermoanaerobaculia bacterium]
MTTLRLLIALTLVITACSDSNPNGPRVSKEPISVRGWIVDVAGSPTVPYQTPETEAVRRTQLFQSIGVWVDNAPYVSGGIAENGSFILLDVPPGNTTITFTPPGGTGARLILENIPGNADVLIPAMLLKGDSVELLEPTNVKVRLTAKVDRPTPSGLTARVAGLAVPVLKLPIAAMTDRQDYPHPPEGLKPLATFK